MLPASEVERHAEAVKKAEEETVPHQFGLMEALDNAPGGWVGGGPGGALLDENNPYADDY